MYELHCHESGQGKEQGFTIFEAKKIQPVLYADQLSLFSFHSTNCPEDVRPLGRRG